MGLRIDHISLASSNIFRSADDLCKETGLGYWTGQWRHEEAVHVVPLGPPGSFIAIGGFVDMHALKTMDAHKQWLLDITKTGEHFNGLCLGVDSVAELEVFAKRFRSTVNPARESNPANQFQRANGYSVPVASTPSDHKPLVWMKGLPSVAYYPDPIHQSAGLPVHPSEGMVRPTGIKWVEYGGTEAQMAQWLGIPNPGEVLQMKFNGKSLGVWAVCIGAEGKPDIIVRRPAASEAVPVAEFAG